LGYKNACDIIFHIAENSLGFGRPDEETKESKIEALKSKIVEVMSKKPVLISEPV
jgi:hypothetical protein